MNAYKISAFPDCKHKYTHTYRERVSFHDPKNSLYLNSLYLEMLMSTKLFYFQFSSITQSCPTFCNPMDCSMTGFPVHHQLPELAQTHVRRVGDVIQPSHPLPSPSPPAFNLSQHQSLFKDHSGMTLIKPLTIIQ